MRYRVEVDREPRATFAEWEDALRFAKAAAAADEERTVQVIETGDEEELILSMRHGYMAIVGSYSYTLPEERASAAARRRSRGAKTTPGERPRAEKPRKEDPDEGEATAPIYYVKEDDILYRARDGAVSNLPNEVLWRSGWRPLLGQFSVGSIPGGGKPGGGKGKPKK